VPLLVIAPLAAFVMAVSGVRTRRSASNLALLGATVTLAATLLAGWGLAKKAAPFIVSYRYLDLSVASVGPIDFQSFAMDIVLRIDHLTVAALVVVEVCVIGVLGWHRVMGRSEPGAARFHALASLFLFGSVGALVSNDLAELFAFWGLAGAATYLLLAHRWGDDYPALRTRVALALPFLTDLILLCGIAVVYSRYGVLNLPVLFPVLHTTAGAGVKSLVVASVLIFVGIAGRLALWPLQSWVTSTARAAPPAALAMTQAVWSVVAIVVLYRVMPIIGASNPQTLRALLYTCGVAACVAPLLALVTSDPRRAIALIGSGVAAVAAAVVVHGFQKTGFTFTFAIAGVLCVFGTALARVSGTLAAASVAAAMRTDDIAEMGDAWRRMRGSAAVLLVAGLVMGLSATGALAWSVGSSSRLGLVLGEAVLLSSVAALRIFFAIAIGPLRRRRAFEPDRVREAPGGSIAWAFLLALLGAVLVVASAVRTWLDFLDVGHKHVAPNPSAYALWGAAALVGIVLMAIAYRASKSGAARASSGLARLVDRVVGIALLTANRFVVGPVVAIAGGTSEWIPTRDDALARSAVAGGRLAAAVARWPVVPAVILFALLLAAALALVSPGVFR
jgi:NADH:ubiquinone oxidoreductase subunit 5 (subunit L)/multisubunit Na+/H+ antiporter MnhA subunit